MGKEGTWVRTGATTVAKNKKQWLKKVTRDLNSKEKLSQRGGICAVPGPGRGGSNLCGYPEPRTLVCEILDFILSERCIHRGCSRLSISPPAPSAAHVSSQPEPAVAHSSTLSSQRMHFHYNAKPTQKAAKDVIR